MGGMSSVEPSNPEEAVPGSLPLSDWEVIRNISCEGEQSFILRLKADDILAEKFDEEFKNLPNTKRALVGELKKKRNAVTKDIGEYSCQKCKGTGQVKCWGIWSNLTKCGECADGTVTMTA